MALPLSIPNVSASATATSRSGDIQSVTKMATDTNANSGQGNRGFVNNVGGQFYPDGPNGTATINPPLFSLGNFTVPLLGGVFLLIAYWLYKR